MLQCDVVLKSLKVCRSPQMMDNFVLIYMYQMILCDHFSCFTQVTVSKSPLWKPIKRVT